MTNGSPRITVRLDPDLLQRAQAAADEAHCNLSEWIRALVELAVQWYD